jgi:hypothetical protein
LSYNFILGEYNFEWQKYANESMGKKDPPISIFYLRTRDMRSYGCPTKFSFIPLSLKLNIYIGCLVPMI